MKWSELTAVYILAVGVGLAILTPEQGIARACQVFLPLAGGLFFLLGLAAFILDHRTVRAEIRQALRFPTVGWIIASGVFVPLVVVAAATFVAGIALEPAVAVIP